MCNDGVLLEKAVLMGVFKTSISEDEISYSMNELERLAEAASLDVCRVTIQRRDKIEAATYIGTGKVQELAEICQDEDADVLIINTELSGSQIKNLTDIVGVKVIDRTTLILDIFALRANTHIAKMQVELAQYKYRMPRLKGFGADMSRTGAGIGSRGPGEQKLEIDRRRISEKIHDLETRLKTAEKKRIVTKQSRKKSDVKTAALVGYTNAGKSSLMNLFIERYPGGGEDQSVFVKDMLFATLDTFHRRIYMENNKEFVLSDTVGFVSDLPHDLINAFSSTLEEALDADVIVHVVDLSNADYDKQVASTLDILDKLGVNQDDVITVYNKVDALGSEFQMPDGGLKLSVFTGDGFENFKDILTERLFGKNLAVKLVIPYAEGGILQRVIDNSTVKSTSYEEDGIHIKAEISESIYAEYDRLGIIKK